MEGTARERNVVVLRSEESELASEPGVEGRLELRRESRERLLSDRNRIVRFLCKDR